MLFILFALATLSSFPLTVFAWGVPVAAVMQWVTLLLYMWFGKGHASKCESWLGPVVVLVAVVTLFYNNITYAILAGPCLLAYIRTRGGYRNVDA